MGQNPQKQDSVIDGTHKNHRHLLSAFNKQKTEAGFSVLRLLIEMFALWAGAAAREKYPCPLFNVIQLRETCHSEAVTDVTAVGIRIQNVRENGLPRQSVDWLAMTKPLTEWHWGINRRF